VLGEIARHQDQWPEAIEHFGKAGQLYSSFADALIGYGRSLTAADKPEQAIEPLERAAKLQLENPTVHYHLAIALRRCGHREDADKELAVYKRTAQQASQLTHDVQAGV